MKKNHINLKYVVAVITLLSLFTTLGHQTALAQTSLLFEDDFNGALDSLPDATKWGDYGPCIDGKQAFGEIRCGSTEHMNGLGQLVVPATPTRGSGMMTWNKFDFKYGTMTAWIKVPSEPGYWPAFWTLNDALKPKSSNPFGEIDVLEYYTFQPQYAHTNLIHSWGTTASGNYGQIWGSKDNYCTAPGVTDLSKAGYVKYSVTVTPTTITGYINDKQCGAIVQKTADRAWPFAPDVDRGNYLISNLAVGGAGGRQPTPAAPAEMLVDRVEVRSLPSVSPIVSPVVTATPSITPTETKSPLPQPNTPDINKDGKVNALDLSLFLNQWGKSGNTDFNNDATTNAIDLSRLLTQWSS